MVERLSVDNEHVRARSSPHSRGAAPFVTYVILFHLGWIVWPFVIYPRLTATFGAETFTYAAVQLTLRISVWLAPVWLYLRYVERVDPFDYLRLKHGVGRGVLVGVALTVLNLAGTIARFGLPHPTLERVTWNSILGTSLLVGVIEEIPYRGFILRKLSERLNFWLANVITSLLFVAIHLPGWIALHTLNGPAVLTIAAFGFVMGLAVKWSDSLWSAIVAHSANDFLSFVVFRL
jgi:membrane protease YdiL (CAAX protease family)